MGYGRPLCRKSKEDLYGVHTKLAFVIPAFAGVLLASILACNNAEPDPMLARTQVELDKHRTLWEQTRSSDYTYEYQVLCECTAHLDQAVKVSVRDGGIKSVVYVESGKVPVKWGGDRGYHTPDSLFDVIQDAITGEADQLIVIYNSEFGYPANITIDYDANATDDEYVLTANAYSPR